MRTLSVVLVASVLGLAATSVAVDLIVRIYDKEGRVTWSINSPTSTWLASLTKGN